MTIKTSRSKATSKTRATTETPQREENIRLRADIKRLRIEKENLRQQTLKLQKQIVGLNEEILHLRDEIQEEQAMSYDKDIDLATENVFYQILQEEHLKGCWDR
jgi:predicted  nucleic acid-binding Zn-ribbon protein